MPASLRAQVVLYQHHPGIAMRAVSSLGASARVARDAGLLERIEIRFGDSSPRPFLPTSVDGIVAHARRAGFDDAGYEHFENNLGSAGGSNRIADGADTDFLLVLNPDTYTSPGFLRGLLEAAAAPEVGAVDGRQLPLEHPKDFDLMSGDTSWASGACTLVRTTAFREVGGFDDEHFFLHCDDVDLSWRLRLAGWKVRHAPAATVFHDKRPAWHGSIEPNDIERFHSLLGRLLLARRYGRPDIESETILQVETDGVEPQVEAVEEFRRREQAGLLPEPIPGADTVAEFTEGEYALHRF